MEGLRSCVGMKKEAPKYAKVSYEASPTFFSTSHALFSFNMRVLTYSIQELGSMSLTAFAAHC